jgi:hypothetical protein
VTKRELVEETRKALEECSRLPVEEQVKRLVASGTIDENGNVLMGRDEQRDGQQTEQKKTT